MTRITSSCSFNQINLFCWISKAKRIIFLVTIYFNDNQISICFLFHWLVTNKHTSRSMCCCQRKFCVGECRGCWYTTSPETTNIALFWINSFAKFWFFNIFDSNCSWITNPNRGTMRFLQRGGTRGSFFHLSMDLYPSCQSIKVFDIPYIINLHLHMNYCIVRQLSLWNLSLQLRAYWEAINEEIEFGPYFMTNINPCLIEGNISHWHNHWAAKYSNF